MFYYQVLVRNLAYRSRDLLTYESNELRHKGEVVSVPLLKNRCIAVIVAACPRPTFQTKAIIEDFPGIKLPLELLNACQWMIDYYAAPAGLIGQLVLPASVDPAEESKAEPKPGTKPRPDLPTLTSEQENLLKIVNSADTYLIHGKTGSGKTRIYIELALKAISGNRSAIILSPEIGLTAQLVKDFSRVFGDSVLLIHSRLTPKQRRQIWMKVATSTQPLVVIGPRSALFVPLKHIGLIVIDEFHEPAYKQEQAPYYQAGRVASKLAELHQAILILGSATPSITEYYYAQRKSKPILKLTSSATGQKNNSISIDLIDLKDKSSFSRGGFLSDKMVQAIESSLKAKQQALIYLNRRGTARLVVCENCGWEARCPNDDLPLAYHGDKHRLLCHVCGHTEQPPVVCPVCFRADVTFKVIGTKAIVDEVTKLFPLANIQRFDTDNKASERLEKHLVDLSSGKVDILIGTQILAKGIDLPRLNTLGIISADSSLTLPDFSSGERTYQLISQVIGRVGRHSGNAKAVIQTYNPNHPIIQAAINSDWSAFYEAEITERKKYRFPPFTYLLVIKARRVSSDKARQAAEKYKSQIGRPAPDVIIMGPTPSFYEKVAGKYEWQLVIKSTDRRNLLSIINKLPKGQWSYNIDPVNLL